MLFMSLGPQSTERTNKSNDFLLAPIVSKSVDAKDLIVFYKNEQEPSSEKLEEEMAAKKVISEECQRKSSYLKRWLSSPGAVKQTKECKYETPTPKNTSSSRQDSSGKRLAKRSISLKFWKAEEDDIDLHPTLLSIDITMVKDISSLCELVKARIDKKQMSVPEISETVQSIYRTVGLRLRRSVDFHDDTEDKAISSMRTFEMHLMRNLHPYVFERIRVEEEEHDLQFESKVQSLYWVLPKHLAAKIDICDRKQFDLLHKTSLELTTMNYMNSAVEKVHCIMNCSKCIFDILRSQPNATESADDFLPLLIYVVLHSNPPHLSSDIRYIFHFKNSENFMTGEEGCYFTHLCSAVLFIENLNARSVGLSEELYQSYLLKSVEKCSIDDIDIEISSGQESSRCISKMYRNEACEYALKKRLDSVTGRFQSLKEQMSDFERKRQAEKLRFQTVLKNTSEPAKVCQNENCKTESEN